MRQFGYTMRKKDEYLEKEMIQGTTQGARARGRPKASWLGNIRIWTGLTLLRTVEVRQLTVEDCCLSTMRSILEPRVTENRIINGSLDGDCVARRRTSPVCKGLRVHWYACIMYIGLCL